MHSGAPTRQICLIDKPVFITFSFYIDASYDNNTPLPLHRGYLMVAHLGLRTNGLCTLFWKFYCKIDVHLDVKKMLYRVKTGTKEYTIGGQTLIEQPSY